MTDQPYMDRLVDMAMAIAETAHAGQVDKAGNQYVLHPFRVAHSLRNSDQRFAQVVGLLHDVIEDSAVTLEILSNYFNDEIVDAVNAITHRKGESNLEYYARVKANAIALEVKLADIKDNLDPARLALLDDEVRVRLTRKYVLARQALGDESVFI